MKVFSLHRVKEQGFFFILASAFLLLTILLSFFLPWLPLKDPNQLDTAHILLSPAFLNPQAAATGHWLGTDNLGRDVLANLLFGFRTAYQVAFPVMLVALAIGGFLGSAAAYFGNKTLKVSWATCLGMLFGLLPACFYGFYIHQFWYADAWSAGKIKALSATGAGVLWFTVAVLLAFCLRWLFKQIPFFRQKFFIPLDTLMLKTIEVLTSVPRLVLVLSLAAISTPGLGNILLLLSLTYWSRPARLIRAEVLRIKQLPYIEAAKITGVSTFALISRHMLPNALGPIITAFTFGLGNLLALEATLSFLGIGLPPETPSWGRMLNEARVVTEAWWLLIFPVLFLCFTILAIQAVGNWLRKSII
jgi:peptide/nickel transport system permease protein